MSSVTRADENLPPPETRKAGGPVTPPNTLQRPRSRLPLRPLVSPQQLAPAPPPSLFDVRVLLIENAAERTRWYNVRLVCRMRPDVSWRVARRYRDFDALMTALQREAAVSPDLPPLPPKRALLTPAEQQRRVLGLEKFCQALLSAPALCAHGLVSAFFDLDFGLWHVRDAAPLLPLWLDPCLHVAAVHMQAAARRLAVRRRLHTATLALAAFLATARRVRARRGEKPSRSRRAWQNARASILLPQAAVSGRRGLIRWTSTSDNAVSPPRPTPPRASPLPLLGSPEKSAADESPGGEGEGSTPLVSSVASLVRANPALQPSVRQWLLR